MKKYNLLIIIILITVTGLVNAGVHIGMPGAVKKKVDDLDKKVEENKIKQAEETADDTGTTPPNAPSSLAAGFASEDTKSSEIKLTWKDNSDNEDCFIIERALDNGGVPSIQDVIVDAVTADSVSYVDKGLNPGTTYWHRVRAVNTAGASEYSNIVSLMTYPVSNWVDADGVGRESINISNTGLGSRSPSMQLDGNGNTHIVWVEDVSGNYEIFYLIWDGSNWVDVDGSGQESINISQTASESKSPSLMTDGNGFPHIAWSEKSAGVPKIYYLKWNGSSWVDADGSGQESINIYDGFMSASFSPSLRLDATGYPHIMWTEREYIVQGLYKEADIYYLRWDGSSWVDVDGSGQESIEITDTKLKNEYGAMTLDTDGNPHFAINWEGRLGYAYWDGTHWVSFGSVILDNRISGSPVLCLDNNNIPHVAYMNPQYDICYLKWNNAEWVDADGSGQEKTVVSDTDEISTSPSLVVNDNDNPCIAWTGSPNIYQDICYVQWDGISWVDADGSGKESINISSTNHISRESDLYIDNNGNPHIAWMDYTPGQPDIYYLKWQE